MADQEGQTPITEAMRAGLQIWLKILHRNRGSSYTFVLGKLPRGSHDIFVDASTEWGIGGYYGANYFLYPWNTLRNFGADYIARKELLAALVGLYCFQAHVGGR